MAVQGIRATTDGRAIDAMDRDPLRTLLERELRAVTEEAIQTGGHVPADDVERLDRLARVIHLRQSTQLPLRRPRWPLIAALAITLLFVSVLLFVRVPETEIELEVVLSEASFVSAAPQSLTDVLNVSMLGVSGLREIHLPEQVQRAPRPDEPAGAIRLAPIASGERQGSISLAALALPDRTRVWIHSTDVPNRYRVSLTGSDVPIEVAVNGPIHVGWPGSSSERIDFETPRPIRLQGGSEQVDVDLTIPGDQKGGFAPPLSVTNLAFFRIDEFTDRERTIARRISTIRAGTLYLESLDGRAHVLRPGEALEFASARGDIRKLRLEDDGVVLEFHGRVRGMQSGSGEGVRRSLMPTSLEWLQARHGLTLLWGTTFYLFGLVAGLLRWWRGQL